MQHALLRGGPGLVHTQLTMPVRSSVVSQRIFTVVVKACPPRVADLQAFLGALDAAIRAGTETLFSSLEQLHFCSFTIFPDDQLGPSLVFESNIDGSLDDYLAALCRAGAATLHAIFAAGCDYHASSPQPELLQAYLRAHAIRPATAFVGNVGRSVRRIRQEAALVARIEEFLDELAPPRGTAPATIVDNVRAFVRNDPAAHWVWDVQPRLTAADFCARWFSVVAVAAGALALVSLGPLGAYVVALRRRELTDPVDIPGPSPEHVQALTEREDQIVQNHMSSLCYVKPGAFRRRTLKVVLFAANLVARVSVGGKLLGLDSLHFAHWALIDGDTRLLFLTNYDGSWENYLDDFIDKVAAGLTAIWSNTRNFPRTSFLLLDGAKDEKRFKAVARTTQAYTNVWYSAYRGLPVTCIEKNRAICEGLAAAPRTLDSAAWLRLF